VTAKHGAHSRAPSDSENRKKVESTLRTTHKHATTGARRNETTCTHRAAPNQNDATTQTGAALMQRSRYNGRNSPLHHATNQCTVTQSNQQSAPLQQWNAIIAS
jgi:hypothetical protein